MDCGTAIWITGIGAITSLGHDRQTFAENLMAGRSGISTVSAFDASHHPSQIAGQVDLVPCPEGWNATEVATLPRLEQMALWCGWNALKDSGLASRRDCRIGVVLGLGAEWLNRWEEDLLKGGSRLFHPEQGSGGIVQSVGRKLSLSGPTLTVAAACASANYAIATARRWLQLGLIDFCLAGACEAGVRPMGMAGFGNLRALSRRNDVPTAASRPFDIGRDGFVMAEGGAVFLLEPAASARKRGCHVYAEVAGCGASSDAHHMVIPSPDPKPAVAAMRQALADARIDPAEIDYVNAHATSTPVGDIAEARVLETVLGERVRCTPVSSTKSMTGHCLTAAAAIEALACLAAMENQAVPPTINLDNPDPECQALCHVPHQSRPHPVRVAVSNSFGFGGSNTCLVLKAA